MRRVVSTAFSGLACATYSLGQPASAEPVPGGGLRHGHKPRLGPLAERLLRGVYLARYRGKHEAGCSHGVRESEAN